MPIWSRYNIGMRKMIFVVLAAGLFASGVYAREGFGFSRKSITMNRTKPPMTNTPALGVAKEGLAYTTDDPRRAASLLREAVDHYQRAIQNNPGEKIFSEEYNSILSSRIGAPLARANASLAAYEGWTAGKHTGGSMTSVASKSNSGAMNNQTLLSMAKAGLTEENLILAIDDADEVAFDTSPNALIALANGGVSKNVIAHMQKRAKKR